MKRIKIAFSQYDDIKNPYYAGGGAYAVHEIAKRFTKFADVLVVTGNYHGGTNDNIDGVNYKRIGFPFIGPKLGQLIYHFLLPFTVLVNKHDIWIESFTPPFSTSFVPLFTKKPVIGLVHMLSGSEMQKKYKFPFRVLENFGLKIYKYFIVMNQADKKKIKNSNPDANIEVIGNGVNLQKKSKKSKKYILFLGRIDIFQKGLDLLIKAYAKNKSRINYPLMIAGSGENKEIDKLKKLIFKYRLTDKVKLLGRVGGDLKNQLLKNSLIVAIPSRYETFSMAALEAMSYGVPCLTFDIDGLKWIPSNSRMVAGSFNIRSYGEKLVKLSKYRRVYEKLSQNSFKFSKTFSWERIFEKYLKFISKVAFPELLKTEELFKNFINLNIKKGKEFVFVSPHLDDAILSCGGLIIFLTKKKAKVKVVNVFSEGSSKPYTISARKYLNDCGYKDADNLYQARRKEDERIYKNLGIRLVNLGFTEAIFRKKKNPKMSLLSKLFPELAHVYPTYRFNIDKGKISDLDSGLADNISVELKRFVNKNSIIFCPAGTSIHSDHTIINNLCQKLFRNTFFWEDYPYNLRKRSSKNSNKIRFKTEPLVFNDCQKERVDIINVYKTQIKGLFGKNSIKLLPEKYYTNMDLIKYEK